MFQHISNQVMEEDAKHKLIVNEVKLTLTPVTTPFNLNRLLNVHHHGNALNSFQMNGRTEFHPQIQKIEIL